MTTKCTSTQTSNSGVQKKKQKNQESSGKSKQKQPILCHNLHTYILRAYIHTYVCIWISVPMRQSQSQSQKAHQPNTTTQRSTAIVVPPLQRPLTQSAPQRTTTSKKETKKNTLKTRRKRSKRMAVDRHSFGDRTGNQHTHTHTCSMKSYKSSFAAVVAANEGLEGIAVAGPSNFVRKIKTNSQKMRETTINKSK